MLSSATPSQRRNRALRTLKRLAALAGAVAGVGLLAAQASATPLYWDTNGTTAGSGNAGGAWNGATANWNSDATGGAAGSIIATTSSADGIFFSAGTDQTSAATVTLTNTQSALGVTLQSTGGVALTGGTLSLNAGGLTINSGVGASSIASAVTINAAQTWTNNSANALTVGGAIAINNALTLAGGSFTFSNTNTGTGGLILGAASTLTIASDAPLGASTTALTFDGGTLRVTSSVSGNSARPITLKPGGGTINLNSGVSLNYQAAWSGIGNLNVNTGTSASGTLDFTGSAGSNSFIGRITLGGGTLNGGAGSVACSTDLRSNPISLTGSSTFTTTAEQAIGEVSGSSTSATLTNQATNRDINVYMLGDATFAGNVTAPSINSGNYSFIFRGNNTETFTGTVGAVSRPFLIFSNTGVTLAGTAALTNGSTSNTVDVATGTFTLDDTSSSISRLQSGHIISFNGGGTFSLLGNSAGTTQALGQYTLTSGAATTNVTNNGGTGAELTFGGAVPTRNSLATINFTNSGTGTLGAAGNNARIRFANAPALTNGILLYGTVNGADFATHDGSGGANGISAYSAYTAGLPTSSSVATTTYSQDVSTPISLAASEAVNALKLINTSGIAASLDVAGNVLTAPAILVPSTNNAPITITGTTGGGINNGTGEMIVHVFGANPLTIAAPVTSGTITKTGDGTLILNNALATNALTGITINQGAVQAAVNGTGLKGGTTTINFRGGILALTGGTTAGSPLTLSAGTGAGQVNWGTTGPDSGGTPGGPQIGDSGDGGFAAIGSDQYVVVSSMTWDATSYLSDGRALLLNSSNATARIHFGNASNGIQLGASTMGANTTNGYDVRPFRVADNPATTADRAVIDGVIAGASANTDLLKTGTGALELTQANTFNGNDIVTEGTLLASNNNALGANASGINACLVLLGQRSGSTTAALLTTGAYTIQRGIVVTDGGVGNAGGAVTIGGMSTSAASTFSGNITSLGTRPITLTAEAGGNVTFSGVIAGASPLTVGGAVANVGTSGTGRIILTGANTYTGATTINSGTLQLSTGGAGSIARSSSITIHSAATLDVSQVAGGFTLASGQNLTGVGTVNGGLTVPASTALSAHVTAGTTGTLTFNNDLALNGGSSLNLNFSTGGNSGISDVINVGGNLTLGAGAITLNATQLGSWTNGVYDILNYSGALLGTGTINFAPSPALPAGYTYSVDTSQANKVLLSVTPPTNNVTWTGGTNGKWDLATHNWTGDSTLYNDPDRVTFNDSVGSGVTAVVIDNQTVSPTSVTFGNTTGKTYSLGGTGSAALSGSTGLVVNGGGTVTLNNTATYNYTGGTVVSNGSTLAVNGTISSSNVSVSGATLDGGGTIDLALTSLGTSTLASTSTLAVNGLTTVSGGTLTIAGALNGSGNITVNSGAALIVNGSTASGKTVTVNGSISGTGSVGGALAVNSGASLSSNGTLYLGSTLDLHGATSLTAGTVSVTGAATIQSGAFTVSTGANLQAGGGLAIGANTLAGAGTVTGNATVAGGAINLSSTGVIAGTLSSTGATTWANSGTVNGLVTVSNGSFTVDTGKSISAAGGIQVAGGATLSGGGTISGGTVVVSGAIQPHVAATETKTLLVYSDMMLNSGATLNFNANGPSGPTDRIILAGGLTLDDGGNYTLNFNSVNNFYPSVQNYTLIATINGVSGLGHWTVTGLPAGTLDNVIVDPNNSNDLVLAITSVPSATKYFNGTASTWNNIASWSDDSGATTPNPAAVPGAPNTAVFNITTQNGAQTVNLDANQAARGLVFNSTGSVTINSGTGTNSLTIGDLGISIASAAGTVAINPAVVLGASQTWTNNKTSAVTTIASTITGTTGQNYTLTLAGPGSITLSSAISDPATSGTTALAINTAGTVTLGGANSYTGGTTVTAGIVKLGNAQALGLGGGITIAAGGAIDLNGKTVVTAPSITSIQGTGVSNSGALYSSNGSASYSGNIALAGPTTIGVGNNLTLSGAITETSPGQTLTKTGGGALTIAGNAPNTYTGLTTMAGGTVYLQKIGGIAAFSGPVTIANGAQMYYGSGIGGADKQFSSAIDLTVQSGGYFESNNLPSNFGENFGNVTLAGYGLNTYGAARFYNNYSPTINGVLTLTGAFIYAPNAANNAYLTLKNGIIVNGSTATSYIGVNTAGGGGDMNMNFPNAQQTINVIGDGVSGPMATNGIDFDVEQNGFINWQGVGFTKTGVGTMKMGNIQNYNNGNTLGNITLSAGKLIMGGSNPLSPTTGTLTLNGGTLAASSQGITLYGASAFATVAATFNTAGVYGFDTSQGNLTLQGATVFNDAAASDRTFDVAANTLTFTSISTPNGAVNFTKTGGGSLAINAATGSFAGNWTLSAGTLRVGAASVVASAPQVSIGGGATLDLSPLSNYTWGAAQSLTTTGASGTTASVKGTVVLANNLDLHVASVLSMATLDINTAVRARLVATGSSKAVLSVNTLSPAGTGALDIEGNALVVKSSTYTAVIALMTSNKIVTTASDPAGNHSLQIMSGQDALANGNATGFAFAGGPTVANLDVLVQYGWNGDLNMDGTVDYLDYGVIDNNYLNNPAPGAGSYAKGDLNGDNVIDYLDYGIMDNAFLAQNAPPAAAASAALSSSAVPEPAALGLLAMGTLGLLARRRRN